MRCILCKSGELEPGHATATFDRRGAVNVIQKVPADVCGQWGEPYFDGPTTDRLSEIVNALVGAGAKVAVHEYADA